MKKTDVVWHESENYNQTRVSLHCFKSVERGPSWNRYQGNKALCSKYGISDDSENFIAISEIEPHKIDETKACKRCLKTYNKMED